MPVPPFNEPVSREELSINLKASLPAVPIRLAIPVNTPTDVPFEPVMFPVLLALLQLAQGLITNILLLT